MQSENDIIVMCSLAMSTNKVQKNFKFTTPSDLDESIAQKPILKEGFTFIKKRGKNKVVKW